MTQNSFVINKLVSEPRGREQSLLVAAGAGLISNSTFNVSSGTAALSTAATTRQAIRIQGGQSNVSIINSYFANMRKETGAAIRIANAGHATI